MHIRLINFIPATTIVGPNLVALLKSDLDGSVYFRIITKCTLPRQIDSRLFPSIRRSPKPGQSSIQGYVDN